MRDSRPDIVRVVEQYVTLRKRGREFVGLCPFHSERTPSFTVNEARGLFHCFGCGAGGDAITFVRRAENCSYLAALQILGIERQCKPLPGLTTGRLRAAEDAAAWADQQRDRLNDLITDRIEQADLADECGDDELLEIFHRELVLFKAFHDSLDSPGGVIELLSVRAALELIAR